MAAKQLWREFWVSLTNPVAALYALATLLLLIGIYKLTA